MGNQSKSGQTTNKRGKKLDLNKETLQDLTEAQLDDVAGGAGLVRAASAPGVRSCEIKCDTVGGDCITGSGLCAR